MLLELTPIALAGLFQIYCFPVAGHPAPARSNSHLVARKLIKTDLAVGRTSDKPPSLLDQAQIQPLS